MSDLSWFNPTPHAIAVYASRPLSPMAAQRSLPSGRYSLLGPDFHRLDRTSLRLAHSFDHLVGDGEHAGRDGQGERLGGPHIDYQLELGRLHHRQVAGFVTAQDAADIEPGLAIGVPVVGAVTHQATGSGIAAVGEDRGQRM